MATGTFKPVISEAFTVDPSRLYSPTVPELMFVTNTCDPDNAIPVGLLNPVISDAFSVAPDVVYSPIMPLPACATNRFDPDTAMPRGWFNPVTREAFTVDPSRLYLPIVPLMKLFVTKICAWAALIEQRPNKAANSPPKQFLDSLLDVLILFLGVLRC